LSFDLNERNLLGSDFDVLDELIDKYVELLREDAKYDEMLQYNLEALTNKYVRNQLLSCFIYQQQNASILQ